MATINIPHPLSPTLVVTYANLLKSPAQWQGWNEIDYKGQAVTRQFTRTSTEHIII